MCKEGGCFQRADLRTRVLVIARCGIVMSIIIVIRSAFQYPHIDNEEVNGVDLKWYYVVEAFFHLLRFSLYVLLHYSVKKNNQTGVHVWLISVGVSFVLCALLMLMSGISLAIANKMDLQIIILAAAGFGLMFDILIWTVVLKFYKQMKEEEKVGTCLENIDNVAVSDTKVLV